MSNVATLKMLLLADDRLSGAFQKTGDAAEKAGKRSSKAMTGIKVAAGLAGAGVLGLLKVGFDEAKDASAGTAQLAAGIKSTGNAANVTVGGLNDLAGQIQTYSGQTDDSIVASEKLLLTFTGIHNAAGKNNDIFNQATKATADMAAKMGGDASKYAVQLGKALNDPIKGVTALTKIGVSFTEGQKAQIKSMVASGNTMGAQKIILGELHKEFGGAAKAAGESLPGQLARGRRAFEDIAQSVVTHLMPIITALANFILHNVMPVFKAITDFIMQHKTVFMILAAVIGTVIVGLKLWAIAQGILNVVMSLNPIALVVIAIAALAAGLIYAYKHSETFRKVVQTAFGLVKAYVMAVWHYYLKPLFLAWKAVILGLGAAGLWLWHNAIKPAWDAISSIIKGAWNNVIKPVASAIASAWTAISDGLSTAWHVITKIFGWIKSGIRAVRDVIRPVVSAIGSAFSAIGTALQWVYDHTIGPILDTIISAIDAVKTALSKLNPFGGTTKGEAPKQFGGTGGPGTGSRAFGKASGGRVYAGVPYLVGEERPEIFQPDVNGTIVPRVPRTFGGGSIPDNGPAAAKLDTTRLEREIRSLGDRIERMQMVMDGHSVGRVMGGSADRIYRGH